jgi:hypothetical protein
MAKGTCQKAGCTIAETGICLLSHAAPETQCPNFQPVMVSEPSEGDTRLEAASSEPETPVPMPGDIARQFHTGLELGTEDAAEIGRARYCHLIGVLGAWDAGKTCFLLSLYLMASRGALPHDYVFAGSLTLKGFEERARRIRSWQGGPLPNQLADHTSLTDPRQPALVHLAIRERKGYRRRFELLLTDLPGEWSKNLVDRAATAERLLFLNRADAIIIVVDGPSLMSHRRHIEIQRTKHLMERLMGAVGVDPTISLTILLTKCDEIRMKCPEAVDDLLRHGEHLGFKPEAMLSAAFSRIPEEVPNGVGVFEALERLMKFQPGKLACHGKPTASASSDRLFASFGSSRL